MITASTPLRSAVGVPQQLRLTDPAGGEQRVPLVARAGELDDPVPHWIS
jgi:hypothetical protein